MRQVALKTALCWMFISAGTTVVVARELGKEYIGIELNPEYVKNE
ncbi:MAG: site-specific DNA-methyltransferase [Paludibacter sp.]|nr:site-specific DNA-methyltransferase [Paludibacter sp.]